MVTVGCMEVSNVGTRCLQRLMPHGPVDILDRSFAISNELNLCRTKERHGEVTRQIYAIAGVTNIHRKGFHQKVAAIAVVKRPRPEEQCDGCVDGRLLATIPGNAQP